MNSTWCGPRPARKVSVDRSAGGDHVEDVHLLPGPELLQVGHGQAESGVCHAQFSEIMFVSLRGHNSTECFEAAIVLAFCLETPWNADALEDVRRIDGKRAVAHSGYPGVLNIGSFTRATKVFPAFWTVQRFP